MNSLQVVLIACYPSCALFTGTSFLLVCSCKQQPVQELVLVLAEKGWPAHPQKPGREWKWWLVLEGLSWLQTVEIESTGSSLLSTWVTFGTSGTKVCG